MRRILSFILLALTMHSFLNVSVAEAAAQEFYEIKIYHFATKDQESRLDHYLQNAYLPALHRAGYVHVGVFKPIVTDTANANRIYVLVPFKTLDGFLKLGTLLQKDQQYLRDGSDYINAGHAAPPYTRVESIMLQAFVDAPKYKQSGVKGPTAERIYELRSYESPTEKLHQSKVKMFNAGGEIRLFDRLGFNAVFYGAVISGKSMPNLMYLTTFENRASRDEHWKAFFSADEWSKLKVMPEYQNTVSRNEQLLLYPTAYSDL